MPLSHSEPLCHFPQISRLIVGVKRIALQPRPSVNDTDVQLRAKLHRLSRFSPHNGPNERLAHADDPVRYAVGTVIVHVLLLLIDGADRVQTLRLARGQIFSEGQFAIDGIQVAPEVSQLLSNGFAGHFRGVVTASCVFQVIFPGAFAVGSRLFRPRDREERPKAFRRSP